MTYRHNPNFVVNLGYMIMFGGTDLNRLADKAAVLLICFVILIGYEDFDVPVVALLVTAALSSVSQSFSARISLISEIVMAALCFAYPVFCCMIPLMLYDFLRDKRPWIAIFSAASVIVYAGNFSTMQIMLLLCGALTAFIMWRNTSRLEEAEKKLILTRDNSEEMNLLLQQKNKQLCENQDNEIKLATMKERNRIAREIHDNVGHMLTRSILQLGALIIINKDDAQRESLLSLKDTLDSAMTSIRNSVHKLHDDSIDLKLAVNEAVKPIQESFNVECDYDFSESMPKKVKLCFMGIIKECLSNTVKHSSGDSIKISVREHPGFYKLEVSDNGSCGRISDSGIGLSTMRERAEDLGGIINISASEKGFGVVVSIPKKDNE